MTNTRDNSRTLRAVRVRKTDPILDAPTGTDELSNYELLERRSRELEVEKARGGLGTSQPPEADTPLLFPSGAADRLRPRRVRAAPKR
jgi:hypothetical protein